MLKVAGALCLVILISQVRAQEQLPPGVTPEDLAKNNKLFIELATKALHWDDPAEPIKIVGPLYFVGTRGLSSWIFVTSEGDILLNTGTPKSGPMIVESIHKLGFKPEDIKIIINGHGHSDHAGAFAYLKKLTGAQIAIMQPDVAMIEDGGKSDFHYGKDWQVMGQPPVNVDRVLRSGDTVRLGEVVLTGYNTPGHTRGATTWVTTIVDGGKAYKVVFPDGAGFNPGYQIANPEEYPGINQDYRDTLHFLEDLQPDIWLAHHTEYFNLEGKRARAATEGVNAWIDPEGYRRWVASKRRAFEDEVDKEMGAKGQNQTKGAQAGLAGTNWQLARFEAGDGKTLTPDDKKNYQVAFAAEGEVSVRIDCNRGHGTWKSSSPSQIEMGPLALTRAMCPPSELNYRLAKDWSNLSSYVLKNGHLFVSIAVDGGTYEFEPIQ